MAEAIRKAGRDGSSRVNVMIRVHDGTDHYVSVAYRRISAENGFALVGTAVDVTELHSLKKDLDHNNKMQDLINRVATLLSSLDPENADASIRKALEITGRVMDVDRIYIWKNRVIDGDLHYAPVFVWTKPAVPLNIAMMPEEGFAYVRSIPEWEEFFERGECVNGPVETLSEKERERLTPYGMKSILALPLFLSDEFWGFVSFDDCRQKRTFTEGEVCIIRSVSLMIATYLLYNRGT
jgi:GAF domain-containing protein